MTFLGLLLRNLRYHWRGHLAVFAGVALGTAVLAGALLVGDSLRGSLQALTLEQLGWVDSALTPGRFFRHDLVKEMKAERAVGALMLSGSVGTDQDAVRAQVLAVDGGFFGEDAPHWNGAADQVDLSAALAQELKVKTGDRVWLNLLKSDAIPRETLLGKRKSDDVVAPVSVAVRAVLPDAGMARFSLNASPEPARNAFVPLAFLQERLGLKGRINAIFVAGPAPALRPALADWGLTLTTPTDRAAALFKHLDPRSENGELRPAKWRGRVPDALAALAEKDGRLTLAKATEFYRSARPYLALQSERMYLDATTEKAAEQAFASLGARGAALRPTLVYLADALTAGGAEDPYAVVVATPSEGLDDAGIRLVAWDQSPLKVGLGDAVTVKHYFPDERNQLQLREARFAFRGHVPLADAADDPDWTPEFPGLTDKLDISGWENPPFPPYRTDLVMKRIRPADEAYWKRHRGTPRAIVTLAAGQKLWATRFGSVTALRVELGPGSDAEKVRTEFSEALLDRLVPARGGFAWLPAKAQALRASGGSADFGGLFLGFSFFLIVSALMLVGLLVRLGAERRVREMGLLAAVGWSGTQLRRLLLGEGAIVALLGAGVGLVLARNYAGAMLGMLAADWPGGSRLAFLRFHATPLSYAIGFGAALAASGLTLFLSLRSLARRSPRELLGGEATATADDRDRAGWASRATLIAGLVGAVAAGVAGFFVKGHEAQAGAFFGSGFLLLAAALALVWIRLHAWSRGSDQAPTLASLGLRNAGRNRVRSLLTVGLLAAATFLLFAVEAFRREPASDFFAPTGGSGGFRLYAETETPLFQNLGDPKVLGELGVPDDVARRVRGVHALRVEPGDDASCLNLYQPVKPRILGVPSSLAKAGRFAFASHPGPEAGWRTLTPGDGPIPALVDANSAQWILKVGLGDAIKSHTPAGDLRVAGLLRESVFQSEVLVSEADFLRLYPQQQGYRFFLIECDEADQDAIRSVLTKALAPLGGRVAPTFDRLIAYFAVENTYLGTFQALGLFGLLLGAVGLALVLVRGVWERRAELALLRALGFRGGQLGRLLLVENLALLALGVAIGCVCALATTAPHAAHGSTSATLVRFLQPLGAIVGVGLAAGVVATLASLRVPVLTALRRE